MYEPELEETKSRLPVVVDILDIYLFKSSYFSKEIL